MQRQDLIGKYKLADLEESERIFADSGSEQKAEILSLAVDRLGGSSQLKKYREQKKINNSVLWKLVEDVVFISGVAYSGWVLFGIPGAIIGGLAAGIYACWSFWRINRVKIGELGDE